MDTILIKNFDQENGDKSRQVKVGDNIDDLLFTDNGTIKKIFTPYDFPNKQFCEWGEEGEVVVDFSQFQGGVVVKDDLQTRKYFFKKNGSEITAVDGNTIDVIL